MPKSDSEKIPHFFPALVNVLMLEQCKKLLHCTYQQCPNNALSLDSLVPTQCIGDLKK